MSTHDAKQEGIPRKIRIYVLKIPSDNKKLSEGIIINKNKLHILQDYPKINIKNSVTIEKRRNPPKSSRAHANFSHRIPLDASPLPFCTLSGCPLPTAWEPPDIAKGTAEAMPFQIL